jgi:peptidyl-prolyl cis-trans isomerase B (cyclophilin B)
MVVELFFQQTPKTIDMFLKHVRKGRYYKLPFERYADDFVIQLAPPNKGNYLSGVDERENGLNHVQGAVGLAWDYVGNKCGSKLYICLAPVPQLNNKHTIIGQVVEGLDVLSQLRPGDMLEKIKIRKPKRK